MPRPRPGGDLPPDLRPRTARPVGLHRHERAGRHHRRRHKLYHFHIRLNVGRDYKVVENFLSKKNSSFDRLRLSDRHMSFDLDGKPFPAKPSAPSYKLAKRTIAAAAAGYFRYAEMFVWADAQIKDHPEAQNWLAHRFPLVILDEMQDTYERQAFFLSAVFSRTSDKIVVQRVGDPNQKIFDLPGSGSGAAEPFPDTDPARCFGIPNSYRFGSQIAAFASPFAVQPVGSSGLCGIGPGPKGRPAQPYGHAVFVFPDDSTDGVLEAHDAYALDVLGQDLAANGPVTAVGHIHRDDPEVTPGHARYPKTVSPLLGRLLSRPIPHGPASPDPCTVYPRGAETGCRPPHSVARSQQDRIGRH